MRWFKKASEKSTPPDRVQDGWVKVIMENGKYTTILQPTEIIPSVGYQSGYNNVTGIYWIRTKPIIYPWSAELECKLPDKFISISINTFMRLDMENLIQTLKTEHFKATDLDINYNYLVDWDFHHLELIIAQYCRQLFFSMTSNEINSNRSSLAETIQSAIKNDFLARGWILEKVYITRQFKEK